MAVGSHYLTRIGLASLGPRAEVADRPRELILRHRRPLTIVAVDLEALWLSPETAEPVTHLGFLRCLEMRLHTRRY